MPISFTLPAQSGQEPQTIDLPSNWSDVTLGQYLTLLNDEATDVEQLLSGLSAGQLAQLPDVDRVFMGQRLRFVLDSQQLLDQVATPGLYEVGQCAYGLFQRAYKLLEPMTGAPALAQGAVLHAIFSEPTTFTLTDAQYEATYGALLARPVTEVYADCQHFLASYQRVLAGERTQGPAQPGVLHIDRTPPAVKPSRNLWSLVMR